jgi:hypothetical protein
MVYWLRPELSQLFLCLISISMDSWGCTIHILYLFLLWPVI